MKSSIAAASWHALAGFQKQYSATWRAHAALTRQLMWQDNVDVLAHKFKVGQAAKLPCIKRHGARWMSETYDIPPT